MKPHAPTSPSLTLPAHWNGRQVWRFVIDRFLLLPLGAVIAIVWANLDGVSYFTFAHRLGFAVNEIGMTLFLGLLAHEALEATMRGGALYSWRRWALPVVAALGGVAGSAGAFWLYVSLAHETVLHMAWPVAAAVDLAAGYYVIKLIAPRSAAVPFVLIVGAVTNAVVIAAALPPAFLEGHISGLVIMAGALLIASALRLVNAPPLLILLGAGSLSWWALKLAGLHPALALVPIVIFLPRRPRRGNVFADPTGDDAVHRYEHQWNETAQVILFLFGLVNAGVLWTWYDTGTWAVLVGALAGRPLGILAAATVGRAMGLHFPSRFGWRELTVVALATTSGFTFALFFATSLLPPGAVLGQIKVGALATVIGAAVALFAARGLKKR